MYNYKNSNINRLFKTNNCKVIFFKNNCNKKLKFKKIPLKKLKKDKNAMSFNNYVFLYKNKAIIYNNTCFKIKHLNYKNSNFLNNNNYNRTKIILKMRKICSKITFFNFF